MREKPSPPHPPHQLQKNVTMRFVPMTIPNVLVQKLRFYLLYNQSNSEFKTIDRIFLFSIKFSWYFWALFFYINLISSTLYFCQSYGFLWHVFGKRFGRYKVKRNIDIALETSPLDLPRKKIFLPAVCKSLTFWLPFRHNTSSFVIFKILHIHRCVW